MGYGLETLPVAIALYLQYKEKLPDKVEVLFDDQDNVSAVKIIYRTSCSDVFFCPTVHMTIF